MNADVKVFMDHVKVYSDRIRFIAVETP